MEPRAAPPPGVFFCVPGWNHRRCGRPARLEKRPGAPIFIDSGDPGTPNDGERKRQRLCSPIAAFRTSWRPDVLEEGPEREKIAKAGLS